MTAMAAVLNIDCFNHGFNIGPVFKFVSDEAEMRGMSDHWICSYYFV